jgi:hypothetical protein
MKRNGRNAFLLSLLSCLAAGPAGIANPQASDPANKRLKVKISPKTKIVKVSEALEVQIEIWNVGSQQVFIEKTVYQSCAHSPLSLRLDLGPPLKPGPGHGCAGDCADDPKENFASRFVKRWIPLPAGHFYGTVVRMDPGFFPQLQTPGRWRLAGEYASNGDLSASICVFSQTPRDSEETPKLPYRGWRGKEETNISWIEVVLPPGRSPKTTP